MSWQNEHACLWSVHMVGHLRAFVACVLTLICSGVTIGRADGQISLVVDAGRTLRVRLNERVRVSSVGQSVSGTVIDPIYAYDRVVIPAGAAVTGHIAKLESPSRWSRMRKMFGGDFSPQYTALIQFDRVTLADGSLASIATQDAGGRERVTLVTTTAAQKTGTIARAKEQAKGAVASSVASVKKQVHDAMTSVEEPGRMDRLRHAAINQLPYHPQYLNAGTVFTAELTAPIDCGQAAASTLAQPDEHPSPQSVLTARLVTPLDSAHASRGSAVTAVLTEPIFSEDHLLIYPEGTVLDGEVTFVKQAASWHRNGQLRFLIERIHSPERESQALLASLYAVEASEDDRLAVDDEGGTSATNSKTRFIAPALAIMSVHAAAGEEHRRMDHDADDTEPISGNANIVGRGVAGWFGFGLVGTVLGQFSRPVAVGFGVYGAVRTTYSNIVSKGREVTFPANTLIQVQLSPADGSKRP
jgi:hypothetical protein